MIWVEVIHFCQTVTFDKKKSPVLGTEQQIKRNSVEELLQKLITSATYTWLGYSAVALSVATPIE